MDGKLIKLNVGIGYRLDDENGILIATTLHGSKTKLSLKNCETIERGFDLDKLAENHLLIYDNSILPYVRKDSFLEGFQTRDEMLKDKKYSVDDMLKSFNKGAFYGGTGCGNTHYFEELILSLQQTEWDVEIEMEEIIYPANMPKEGESRPSHKPKLDSNGCLILKRK